MIQFFYNVDYRIKNPVSFKSWLKELIRHEGYIPGTINYIFCCDEQLLTINNRYLQHDTYTDIITFDNCEEDRINGEIFISLDRITENSMLYKVSFEEELVRVIAHGVLHLCGYKDKSEEEAGTMRKKESEAIELFILNHKT